MIKLMEEITLLYTTVGGCANGMIHVPCNITVLEVVGLIGDREGFSHPYWMALPTGSRSADETAKEYSNMKIEEVNQKYFRENNGRALCIINKGGRGCNIKGCDE